MKQKISFYKESVCEKEIRIKRKKKILIFSIIGLSIVGSFSLLLFNRYSNRQMAMSKESHYEKIIRPIGIEKHLNDEIEKIALEKSKVEVEEINIRIHDILGEKEKHYGVYYYDLSTGYKYVLNDVKEFKAASTMKVPIAMMIADKLKNKELEEDTLIEYSSDDNSNGAGVLQGDISEGDKKEVMELMKYMLVESDNIATSMLKRNAGNLCDYLTDMTLIKVDNESNYITPKQSCMILQRLYEKSKDNIYYEKIIDFMKQTTSHDRIDKYIPNDIVAHKIGDYKNYVNDIGLVYTDKPYILAIYTEDVMEEGRENIAQISKAIYEIKTDN